MNAENIIPYLPLIGGVLVAIIPATVGIWNRKRGAVESRIPTVTDVWEQQARQSRELDLERRLRRWYEHAFWAAVNSWRGYIRRIHNGGSPDLKPHEKDALDATPPNIEKE